MNGKSDGNAVHDAGTQIMLGLLGASLHPRPRLAMVVGLGTGESAGWLAQSPSIDRVDVIELEPAVREMADRCRQVNFDVLRQANVRLVLSDAREVLLTSQEQYDLIVCEPSNPYRSGVANLFTQEFYRAVARRLNDDGLFVQWLQAYETDGRTIRTVLRTLRSVFPELQIWEGVQNDLIIVGSMRPLVLQVARMREQLSCHPFPEALQAAWVTSGVEGLLSHFIGGGKLVEVAINRGEAGVNTDDRNEIEYAFARTLGMATGSGVPLLRKLAALHDATRPATSGDVIDWGVVSRERDWIACEGRADPDVARPENPVLERHVAKDAPGMLSAWEKSPAERGCCQEVGSVAMDYAMAGDGRADAMAARLRAGRPTEALMIRGMLASRQGRFEEAVELLTAAIRQLRVNPWVMPAIRENAFDAAIALSSNSNVFASRFLEALSEPFAAATADESRRDCALLIGASGPKGRLVSVLESYEPHVPWTRRFLTFRANIYRETHHPLAVVAQRELAVFEANAAPSVSAAPLPARPNK